MRTCPQAGPMPTLGADLVLPGLLAAMARTDTVMTTWLALTLPTSPLRLLPPCKLLTRYAYYDERNVMRMRMMMPLVCILKAF